MYLVLPDSTASDLDQHLSSLVGTPPATQMSHQNLLSGGSQTPISSSNGGGTNGLLIPRYHSNSTNNDYNLHTSQNGPRSLSDSSAADSPVQDDLLTSNTPNLGGNNNQNFNGINQNQNTSSYGSGGGGGGGAGINGGGSGGGGNNCNGSIYPVLPASLLYSQLYTAANQTHGFHSHSLQTHSSQNSVMHAGELQSVMDHIATNGSVGLGGVNGVNGGGIPSGVVGVRNHHNLMPINNSHTDITTLVGNCGAAVRAAGVLGGLGDDNGVRQVALNGQRGQPQQGQNDNGNSVWRPY